MLSFCQAPTNVIILEISWKQEFSLLPIGKMTDKEKGCLPPNEKKCKEKKKSVEEADAKKPKAAECVDDNAVVVPKVLFKKFLAIDESKNELDKITWIQFKTGLFGALKLGSRGVFAQDSSDPVDVERAKCLKDCKVEPVYKLWKACDVRVTRKIRYTAETCHEETIDLMEALDKCVKSKAFLKLK